MEPDEAMNPRNLMEEFWSVWWAWMDELQGRAQMPCGLVVVWSSWKTFKDQMEQIIARIIF